jgi:hypothetical protein
MPNTFSVAAPPRPADPGPEWGTAGGHRVANPYDQRERVTDLTPKKRRVLTPYIAGLMTCGIAGGTLWTVHNAISHSKATVNTGSSTAGTTGSNLGGDPATTGQTSSAPDAPTTGGQDQTPAPVAAAGGISDLLTPAGSKAMLAALEKADGGTNIVSMTVYPTYASFEVVKKSDHTVYDNWTFRDGVASFDSPGSTLEPGDNTINPATIKLDVLTSLFQTANKTLKVPHPTNRYYIVDSDLIEQTPELMVYLSDDYGSGYIAATLDGKITRTYPKGS